MAEPKGIGKKLLGLFVESDGADEADAPAAEEGEKSAADLVAELASATAPAGPGAARPASAPPGPNLKLDKMAVPAGDKINFDEIFTQGGLDPAGLERVTKAETLLKGLPEATPTDVKKQIVEASLRAFGIDVVSIIQATNTQLQALDLFVKVNSDQTVKAIIAAEEQIKQHNEKIASLRAEIDKRTGALAATTNAATARKSEVQRVLDFFGAAKA